MMTCSRRYFSGSACGSSRVLMIGPLQRGLEPDLDLEEVGALAELEAVVAAVLADPDPARRRMTTWRLTKNGVRWRTMSANGVERRIR